MLSWRSRQQNMRCWRFHAPAFHRFHIICLQKWPQRDAWNFQHPVLLPGSPLTLMKYINNGTDMVIQIPRCLKETPKMLHARCHVVRSYQLSSEEYISNNTQNQIDKREIVAKTQAKYNIIPFEIRKLPINIFKMVMRIYAADPNYKFTPKTSK